MTIWKGIDGFFGYEVSDEGEVRSWWKTCGSNRVMRDSPILLVGSVTSKYPNYRTVSLSCLGVRSSFLIHHLVLDTFSGPKPSGAYRLHIDGNARNNRLSNLRYGSPTENCVDRRLHGNTLYGSKNHKSKLTADQVIKIRKCYAAGGVRQIDLAKEYGITQASVSAVLLGKVWSDPTSFPTNLV